MMKATPCSMQLCVTAMSLFLLMSVPSALVSAQNAKGASVSLLAKWPGTSLLLETLEFLVRV